jgi:hypothetical protein
MPLSLAYPGGFGDGSPGKAPITKRQTYIEKEVKQQVNSHYFGLPILCLFRVIFKALNKIVPLLFGPDVAWLASRHRGHLLMASLPGIPSLLEDILRAYY